MCEFRIWHLREPGFWGRSVYPTALEAETVAQGVRETGAGCVVVKGKWTSGEVQPEKENRGEECQKAE
jgi:hypothetical protein